MKYPKNDISTRFYAPFIAPLHYISIVLYSSSCTFTLEKWRVLSQAQETLILDISKTHTTILSAMSFSKATHALSLMRF